MKHPLLTAAFVISLSACSTATTPAASTTLAISDAQTVVNGLSADYKTFVVLYPMAVPATQQTRIAADFAAAQTALTALSAIPTGLPAANNLQSVETAMNDVVNVVAGVLPAVPGVPASVTAGVEAASVLLPLIELTVNQLQGASTPVTASSVAPKMTADQARLVLKAAH